MKKLLLEMKDIHKSFREVHALRGVNFNVNYNEVVGLVGDNGAGKTTLIKILTGIHPLDKGQIYFEGKEVKVSSPRDARNLGIETVYQDQALAPQQSLARNVFMGREPTKFLGYLDMEKLKKTSIEVIESIGFVRMKSPDAKVETLSGGEREGVAIARAMHFKAKLLVLDEPTIALSVKETRKVLGFVERVRNEGTSCIFITHNLYHVYPVADRFVLLNVGRKIGDVQKEDTSIDDLAEKIVTGGM